MDRFPTALALQDLHPALWLGHQLGRPAGDGVSSGFAELDRHLPGGGWPRRTLSELLLKFVGAVHFESLVGNQVGELRVRMASQQKGE